MTNVIFDVRYRYYLLFKESIMHYDVKQKKHNNGILKTKRKCTWCVLRSALNTLLLLDLTMHDTP